MSKKVYKKKKKVIEKAIYVKKSHHKKLNLTTYFLLLMLFFVTGIFYYLNILLLANNTTPFTIKYLLGGSSKIHVYAGKNSDFIPFSVNWQNMLLSQNLTSVISKKEIKKVAVKMNDSSDQIIWHGSRDKKEVALTFDADMTPVMVDWLHSGQVSNYDDTRITNYLIQHQIKATFFLTGLWIQSYPMETKQLAENPLIELENHTMDHPSMAGDCFDQPHVPESQYPSEIEKVQQLLQQIAHVTPKYFRFPGGCYDQSDLALVKKEGLVTVHWDDVANDGFNDNEQQIIDNVLSEAQNGSIIVLHMGGESTNVPQTANALPTIIDGLKKKGYTFVTVNELLNPPKIVAQVTPAEYLTSLKSFHTFSP